MSSINDYLKTAGNFVNDSFDASITVLRHPVDTYHRNVEFYGPTVKSVVASVQTVDNFIGDSIDALVTVDTYFDFYGPMIAGARANLLQLR